MKIREVRTLKISLTEQNFATLMAALAVCQRESEFESVRDDAGKMYRELVEARDSLRPYPIDTPNDGDGYAVTAYEGTKLGKR
jgi:hypothetical protein